MRKHGRMTTKKDSIYTRIRLRLFGQIFKHKLLLIWILFIMSSIFITSFNDYIAYDFEDDHGFEVSVWSWIIFVVCSFILYCVFKLNEKGDVITVFIILVLLLDGILLHLGLANILMWIVIIRLFLELFLIILECWIPSKKNKK